MPKVHRRSSTAGTRLVSFATAYDRQTEAPDEDTLVIPEDLTAVSDEDLASLAERANSSFDALYGDGSAGFTQEDLDTLAGLTEAIETVAAEQSARQTAADTRAEAAAALAARVHGPDDAATEPEADGDENAEDAADENEDENADAEADDADNPTIPTAVAAAAAAAAPAPRGTTRVNLSALRSRQSARPSGSTSGSAQQQLAVAMAAPDVPGFSQGSGLSLLDMGRAIDNRMTGFNQAAYASAAQAGRTMRQQYGVAVIRKQFTEGAVADGDRDANAAMDAASDEALLPGGSLVASGGWCAPSETMYELFDEGISREGLLSAPEIQVARGGIRWTRGPNFADVLATNGFAYTEADDIAGNYAVDGNGVGTGSAGSKPCFKVTCDDFEEARLGLDGLCITAGLLQRRGYPEMIAATVQLALIAHDHRLSGRKIAALVTGSTGVTMPALQVGAVSPLLTAIELEVEHMRAVRRLSRSRSMEVILPFWANGVIRSDLSRRLGMNLQDVTDAQIRAWFSLRGANVQYVYNWQGIEATAVAAFTSWPTTIKFLIYPAGTWVFGSSDVITLDTLYDSTLLGENDYTALFTEEAWLVAKRGYDSRVVTTNISGSGHTGAGVLIDADGSIGA